jgi:uncharacterized protein YcfJ
MLVVALSMVLASTSAVAGKRGHDRNGDFYDRARVVQVTTLYREVPVSTTVRECIEQPPRYRPHGGRTYTPEILGSIVGGVVGNQFGRGRGKTALTVAGAVLGASVGHDVNRRMWGGGRWDSGGEQCYSHRDVRMERELQGYRVRYRYRGQEFVTRTREHPGDYIRVKVGVTPAGTGRKAQAVSYRDHDECFRCEGKEYF